MTTQAQPQAPVSRRQIAAARRSERLKKAKAWLATRKDSKTPVTDRVVAEWVADGWNYKSAVKHVKDHCLMFLSAYSLDNRPSWVFADCAAAMLERLHFSSERNSLADAVGLLKEQGAPVQYWKKYA